MDVHRALHHGTVTCVQKQRHLGWVNITLSGETDAHRPQRVWLMAGKAHVLLYTTVRELDHFTDRGARIPTICSQIDTCGINLACSGCSLTLHIKRAPSRRIAQM